MSRDASNGIPLQEQAPKARITKAIEAIANVFDDPSEGDQPAKKQKRGLFIFLSSN